MSRILTVLPGIPGFQSGAGDINDVLVKVREDAGGGWFPVIHSGNYFIGTEERYLFADKGTISFSTVVTSGTPYATGSVSVTGLLHDPTKFGPVFVEFSACPRPMRRVCSPLRAFRLVTPVATGDFWSFTVPGSGILVSLVSDPVTGILVSVPSTGDLRTTEDYYYDPSQGKVFLKGDSFPSLFATYLVNEQDPEMLKQEEILVVDRDGLLRTQYKNVLMTPWPPKIRKPTAAGTITCTAISASGNVVTPPTTGTTVSSGDVVAIEYYVQNSYIAVPIDDSGLRVSYLLSLSGDFTVEYELSDQVWYDTSLLPSGDTNSIQLNPLLTQRESGFLYLVDPATPYESPASISIDLSDRNPLLGEVVIAISATVLDSEGQPLPGQRVVARVIAGSGNAVISPVFPPDQISNERGQVVYATGDMATGLVEISFAVSGTSVSGVAIFYIRDLGFYNRQSELQLGKLLLSLEDTPTQGNLFKLSAYYCYPDGAPFEAPNSSTPTPYPVTFTCQLSQLYTLNGTPVPKTYQTTTNDDSIASILINPIPGDTIRAFVQTPVSGRVRNAPPIFIPEGSS